MLFAQSGFLFGSITIFTASVTACNSHHLVARSDYASIVSANLESRSARRSSTPPPRNIVVDNVRVFDGHKVQPPSSIYISNGLIAKSVDCKNATRIDGEGQIILPGLIDTHCHPSSVTHLESLARHGITTGLTMACFSSAQCNSLTGIPGVADLRFASAPASAPGSVHGNITTMVDPTLLLNGTTEVPAWMARQLSQDPAPDFIKLISETPGLDQNTLVALVAATKKAGKLSVTHASTLSAYEQAVTSGSKHIHHAPLDSPLVASSLLLKSMKRNTQITAPTLTMMRAISISPANPHANYTAALLSTHALYHANIPILAGTDANAQPGVPASVPFGSSMHDELFNLVEAGLSNVEALRAATLDAARLFGLSDRGRVEVGMRADLVLVGGDPLVDLEMVRDVKRVWVCGVEVGI